MQYRLGVDYDQRSRKFRARITQNGVVYHLGNFDTFRRACNARAKAEQCLEDGVPFKFHRKYGTPIQTDIESDQYLYWLSLADKEHDNPLRALLAAVLLQAVKDFLGRNKRVSKNAELWFLGIIESCPGFSFKEACITVGISPSMIRDELKKASRSSKTKKLALQRMGRRLVKAKKEIW